MNTKRVALYLRVSTDQQTTENQAQRLRAVAECRGWTIVQCYEDAGISGAKGRDKRPALDQMLKDASRRKFDILAVWSLDRLGRSLADLVSTFQHLEACGVDVFIDQQSLDTTTPAGRLLFHVTAAFAQFEREIIVARVKAGIARAQARGTKSGRKIGRPKIPPRTAEAIRLALVASHGLKTHAIAAEAGVGHATVQRIRRAMNLAA